jgi:hypothetical protein
VPQELQGVAARDGSTKGTGVKELFFLGRTWHEIVSVNIVVDGMPLTTE